MFDKIEWLSLTLGSHGRAGLNLPLSIRDARQLEGCKNFVGTESQVEILFVSKYEERQASQCLLSHELLKLCNGFFYSLFIGRVDDEDDTICALKIILPVGADRLLTTNIPHVQLEAILRLYRNRKLVVLPVACVGSIVAAVVSSHIDLHVCFWYSGCDVLRPFLSTTFELREITYQGLDVEALRRLDLTNFFLRQFLQDSRFTSVIKTEDEDLRLFSRLSSQVAQQIKKSHIVFPLLIK